MNLATYSFSLDVHKRGSQLMIEAKKGDTGRKLFVTLMENGKPYNITSDCYAVFRARKTDGTVLYNDCVIEDNEISYTITQQTLAVPGILDCEITLYGSDKKQITSPSFGIIVDETVQSDDEIESTNEFTALAKLVGEVGSIDHAVDKALQDAIEKGDISVENGKSAYEIALDNGFEGTETEWIESLKGEQGIQGIQGDRGEQGIQGIQGEKGDKGDPGEKGEPGADGAKGDKGDTGSPGERGEQGAPGKDGIGIKKIEQTIKSVADDGTNVITVTLTDDSKHTFEVQNGSRGSDGESIGVANYDADDDYTTVAFTNGDVIQIPSGVGIKNIRLSKQTDTGNTYTVELTNGQDYDFVAPAGPVGATGANGKDGYTPIKGTDYFTENDKKELIASLSQVETPQIVSSIDEMTDPTKHYVLQSTGTIWSHRTTTTDGETVLVPNFTNLIKFDASGNPMNVALNQRYSGSAGEAVGYLSSQDGSFAITDLIINSSDSPVFYINKKPVGQSKVANFISETEALNGVSTLNETQWENGENGEYKCSVASSTSYKKFSAQISTSAIAADSIKGLIVTINEPIAYTEQKTEGTTVSEWYDTGISYSPTFKTDLIGVMGEDNVIYLSDNLPSGTYTLKYPDNDYAIVGTISK